jgi:regulatory protein
MLDDREFARYWAENRIQFNPRGANALGHELRGKGVPASIIAETLADLDEEAAARKVLEAGVRRLAHLEPGDFRRKLGAYMARRGFSYEVIAPLVEEALEAVRCEALSEESEG